MKPPGPSKVLFLAGTIDNGNSVDWQAKVEAGLEDLTKRWLIINPRLDEWDPEASDSDIAWQANWEMDWIHKADHVFFVFLGNSLSPITLAELGLCLASKEKEQLTVLCPREYYRWANVKTMCNRYGVRVYLNPDSMVALIRGRINPIIGL